MSLSLYHIKCDERYSSLSPLRRDVDGSNDRSGRGRRSKVARLIEEYDLQGLGSELERLWTADEDRRSLRELAAYFNEQVLEAELEEADVQLLDGELENIYRLLTDDDVNSADRMRARRQLERDGIDINELKSNFVTYQAIRSYLKEHRGAEYTPDETDPIEREKTNIQQLRGRMVSVTDGRLEQLQNTDRLTIGESRILVNIQVVCEDCNSQFDVLELLTRGGCECSNRDK